MKTLPRNRKPAQRYRAGQTLIMALFVLGILLVLGFVFIGVINQNIRRAGTARGRAVVNDLAEAGIRYAHNQLVYSAQGADFRLAPTGPVNLRDPDLDYLRLDPDGNPNNGDQGGPDGFGSYSRVNFPGGRALVRVRWAPSETANFSGTTPETLRQPAKAHNYLIIESIGREGRVTANDPTTLLNSDRRESRKLVAFASMGMLEAARFIHNKDRVSRPADIGMPTDMGLRFEGLNVSPPVFLGGLSTVLNFTNPVTPSVNPVPSGGSLISNADLQVHGNVTAFLNASLGESWLINGNIAGADANAVLTIRRAAWNAATSSWDVTSTGLANGTGPSLNSKNGNFSTVGGVLRDAFPGADAQGYVRSTQFNAPPLISTLDPVTGRSRFEDLTRDSGALGPAGNIGRFGHGQGVWVSNPSDRQNRSEETGREDVGTAESLVYDWFNPNNGQGNSGWQGPFYVPRGAYLQLVSDGFIIVRDARSEPNERTWRRPDGTNTGSSFIRYRIGDPDGAGPIRQPYIINSFTPGVNINDPNPDFSRGAPFNGVVMFDGNVRMRGVIPSDLQLTVVTNATAYIEGSVTKGLVGNRWTAFDPVQPVAVDARMARPSKSMLMIMAKEYVAVNSTMFFGPPTSQSLEEVSEAPGALAYNPIRVREAGGTLDLNFEMLLDPATPGSVATNPSSWELFGFGPGATQGYREFGNGSSPGNFIEPKMLATYAMDDGPAPFTFMSMDVNIGIGNATNPSTYLFPMDPVFPYNSASGQGPYVPGYTTPGYTTPNWIPLLGQGSESWQRYPKFETAAYPLVSFGGTTHNFPLLTMNAPQGKYRILSQEGNTLTFRHNNVGSTATNDWLLARVAVVPHDIRIEAAVYAEEGSFAYIPGNWFNPNPNDTRQLYTQRAAAVGAALANQERRENFGAHPDTPFYGEPIDVKVTIVGSVTENMPLPIGSQAEWLKKWGWIPRWSGATNRLLPTSHVPNGYDIRSSGQDRYVPNLYLVYDPALGTGRTSGYDVPVGSNTSQYIRRDDYGRPLPPMPRLPVSPTLSYFGEVLP